MDGVVWTKFMTVVAGVYEDHGCVETPGLKTES